MPQQYISMGTDIARSGQSAFCVLAGVDWHVRMIHLSSIASVTAPEVEAVLVSVAMRYEPHVIVLESNGPGAMFADFVAKNQPGLALATIDTSLPATPLPLWGSLELTAKEILNIRTEMHWIVRLLLRDRRLTFDKEDEELFAQLSSMTWDYDRIRGDRIALISKRNLRLPHGSELEVEPFSRSPDKADALALAALGYAALQQRDLPATVEIEEDIIQPEFEGFYDIGRAGIFEG